MSAYGTTRKTNFAKMTIRVLDPNKVIELEETFYKAGHYETVNSYILDLIYRGLQEKRLELERIKKIVPPSEVKAKEEKVKAVDEHIIPLLESIKIQNQKLTEIAKSNSAILSTLSVYILGDDEGNSINVDLAKEGGYTDPPDYAKEKDFDCAWSVWSCMFDRTGYVDEKKCPSLQTIVKELEIQRVIGKSTEPGIGFEESITFDIQGENGITCDERDIFPDPDSEGLELEDADNPKVVRERMEKIFGKENEWEKT